LLKTISTLVLLMITLNAQSKVIETVMGPVTVPEQPKRIIVLTNEGTEALVALGVTPVGAVKAWQGHPWYPHLEKKLSNTKVVGLEHNVNLEQIVALKPDLILGNRLRLEKIYPTLSAIAPTVFSDRINGDWQSNFELWANAISKEKTASLLLAEYHQQRDHLATQLGDNVHQSVSLVRFLPSQTRLYFKDTFAGGIVNELGFTRPVAQNKDAFALKISKENYQDIQADVLFYYVYDKGDGKGRETADQWLADPLWQNLAVVKANKAFAVDDIYWNTSGSIISAQQVLTDIHRFLLQ